MGSAGGSAGAYGDAWVIQDQAALVIDQSAGEAEGWSDIAVALVSGFVGQPRVALFQSFGTQIERADVRGRRRGVSPGRQPEAVHRQRVGQRRRLQVDVQA